MIDPRKPIFDAVKAAREDKPFDTMEVGALDNLLDALGVPRKADQLPVYQLHDTASFFKAVRLVTGSLTQVQVNSVNGILAAAKHHPIGWVAYELVTAWHEARFVPQDEWGEGDGRPYAKPGKYGQPQFGRGLVQLTWDRNYEWADKACAEAGLTKRGEILADFNKVKLPEVAAFILVKGMEDGAFTGKALHDYLPANTPTREQFENARRIINGTDKAAQIAQLADKFLYALDMGRYA